MPVPDNRGKSKTKSKLSLSQRRERAFELFARGYSNIDVRRDLKVSKQTVTGYRKLYNDRVHAQAAANPNFLRDVVTNTMHALEELDRIRADAWKHMEPRKIVTEHECPECGTEFEEKEYVAVGDDTRSKYMGHLLKAQEMRAKLLGVLGVKTDIFVAVMQVKVVADHLMRFMGEELCPEDREKLAEFLTTPELQKYMGDGNLLDSVDAEVIEDRELEPV